MSIALSLALTGTLQNTEQELCLRIHFGKSVGTCHWYEVVCWYTFDIAVQFTCRR